MNWFNLVLKKKKKKKKEKNIGQNLIILTSIVWHVSIFRYVGINEKKQMVAELWD